MNFGDAARKLPHLQRIQINFNGEDTAREVIKRGTLERPLIYWVETGSLWVRPISSAHGLLPTPQDGNDDRTRRYDDAVRFFKETAQISFPYAAQ